ncbi:MAG: 4Fe-4S cluster-binding domain-containing protein, partial [Clostridia bacterium]|nr:4Fe-4S cluster-binding domain-containing protein [Clostridia bacterium]
MVHCFKYNHKGRDYHFLWDVESGSLHNVDKTAYLVAKNRYGELSESEKQAYLEIKPEMIEEIQSEFEELENAGGMNTPAYSYAKTKRIGEIKALCLHICHDCNLRCKYCFADEGTYHSKCKEYMSFEIGKKAIDFLISKSGNRQNLEVDFFGGEPLMNLDVVKQIVDYARGEGEKAGKSFNFTLTTNCLLLNDEAIDWLNKEMYNVVLSIDGREAVHDRLRRTANDKGSQAIVLDRAKKFAQKRGDKSYYVRGTFTAYNLDFANDILYLRDEGFEQISIEPVVLPEDSPMAIRKEHLPQIMAEYERLGAEYLESRANGLILYKSPSL